MSTDLQLARRPSAELITGGFVALPLGVLLFLATRSGHPPFYPAVGLVLAAIGWGLLGVGFTRLSAKVDDLYRSKVTASRTER